MAACSVQMLNRLTSDLDSDVAVHCSEIKNSASAQRANGVLSFFKYVVAIMRGRNGDLDLRMDLEGSELTSEGI
jgi:succinyl-CoA synthetase alpha subunit